MMHPNSQPLVTPHAPVVGKKPKRKVLTSLSLQVFIYFGAWYDLFYWVLNILVFVYKGEWAGRLIQLPSALPCCSPHSLGTQLPYPSSNFALEFSFSWIWPLVAIPSLYLLSKGNKTESAAPVFFGIFLALLPLAMYVYFVAFQTYVLKVDLFLNGVAIFFVGLQVLLGLFAAIVFLTASKFA